MDRSLRITNIVAVAQLNCPLDLTALEKELDMGQYLPKRFSGLLVRVLHPFKAHCQLYKNGKITVNGARSIRAARALAQRFCIGINKIGYACFLSDFTVVNMVASYNYGQRISLEKVVLAICVDFPQTDYCPEIFSGLTVRLPTCTAVLFHSGKINFLGARSELDLQAALIDIQLYL